MNERGELLVQGRVRVDGPGGPGCRTGGGLMKALTVQQPLGWAILRGGCNVANLKVDPHHLGSIAVHAGLRYAGADVYARVERLTDTPLPAPGAPGADPAWAFGAVIGVVDLVGVHRSGECGASGGPGCSPWADPFCTHLELANPRTLTVPIECPGARGVWQLDELVEKAVRRQLA